MLLASIPASTVRRVACMRRPRSIQGKKPLSSKVYGEPSSHGAVDEARPVPTPRRRRSDARAPQPSGGSPPHGDTTGAASPLLVDGISESDGSGSPGFPGPELRANQVANRVGANRPIDDSSRERRHLTSQSTPLSPSVVSGLVGIADCVSVLGVGFGSYLLYLGWGVDPFHVYVSALVIAAVMIVTAFYFANLYEFQSIVTPEQQQTKILLICGIVFLLLVTFAFALKISQEISRVWSFSSFIVATTSIYVLRLWGHRVLRKWAEAGLLSRNIAIVGTGDQTKRLLEHLKRSDEPWNRIVGIFDDRTDDAGARFCGHRILGRIDELQTFSKTHRIDDVIVTLPWNAESRLTEIIDRLQELPVHIRLGPDLIGYVYPHKSYSFIGDAALLDIFRKPLSGWQYVAKYLEDKLLTGALVALLAPLMLLIALLIKLDSRGPVLFRQTRYGFNNSKFSVFKFRTMYADSDFQSGSKQAQRDDPRVTRVGRFLRRTSLDELPQLFNVLQGSMSLVGPRPHPVPLDDEYATLIKRHFSRYRVKPGITGWAQIKGLRGETETPSKMRARVEHDSYYIENWSIFLDLRILLSTVIIILTQNNAH